MAAQLFGGGNRTPARGRSTSKRAAWKKRCAPFRAPRASSRTRPRTISTSRGSTTGWVRRKAPRPARRARSPRRSAVIRRRFRGAPAARSGATPSTTWPIPCSAAAPSGRRRLPTGKPSPSTRTTWKRARTWSGRFAPPRKKSSRTGHRIRNSRISNNRSRIRSRGTRRGRERRAPGNRGRTPRTRRPPGTGTGSPGRNSRPRRKAPHQSQDRPPADDRSGGAPEDAGPGAETPDSAPGEVPEISPEQAERILAALADVERAFQEDRLEKRRARALRRGRH